MAAGGLPANHVRCPFSACAAAAVLQRQAAMPIAPASCIPAPFDPCTCRAVATTGWLSTPPFGPPMACHFARGSARLGAHRYKRPDPLLISINTSSRLDVRLLTPAFQPGPASSHFTYLSVLPCSSPFCMPRALQFCLRAEHPSAHPQAPCSHCLSAAVRKLVSKRMTHVQQPRAGSIKSDIGQV